MRPGDRAQGAENNTKTPGTTRASEGASSGSCGASAIALKKRVPGGVPMMNGASTARGLRADVDATIVTRMLDAAARSPQGPLRILSASQAAATPARRAVQNPRSRATRRAARHRARRGRAAVSRDGHPVATREARSASRRVLRRVRPEATHVSYPIPASSLIEMTRSHRSDDGRRWRHALLLSAGRARRIDPRQIDVKTAATRSAADW